MDGLEYGVFTDITVWVTYFHTGEMEGDLDNIAKPILDALNTIVWSDDRQISVLTLRRVRLDEDPLVLIEPPEIVRDAIGRVSLGELQSPEEFVYVRFMPSRQDGRVA